MKRLAACVLLAMLATSVAGCGKKEMDTGVVKSDVIETPDDEGLPEETDGITPIGEEAPLEGADEEEPSGDGAGDDIWQQCLDMTENAVLGEFPQIAVNGIGLSMDWTLDEFLATGLADNAKSIDVTVVKAEDGGYSFETVHPTIGELKAGMKGADVFIITDELTVSFETVGIPEEEMAELDAGGILMDSIHASENFTCKGIRPGASTRDVATAFGPTQYGGDGLLYRCGGPEGYVQFHFIDDGLNEIYLNPDL